MAVEEVIGSCHNFVPDQGVEVTSFDAPIALSEFSIQLRNGKAISAAASEAAAIVPAASRVAECLCIAGINPVHGVHAKAPVEAFAAVSNFFSVQPSLMEVQSIRMVVERQCGIASCCRRSHTAVVPHLDPTTECDLATVVVAEETAATCVFTTTQVATYWGAAR